MAQSKNTTNFQGLLFQFMDSPDPMLSMLEWLCSQMMEAEVSNKLGAEKHEQFFTNLSFHIALPFHSPLGSVPILCTWSLLYR